MGPGVRGGAQELTGDVPECSQPSGCCEDGEVPPRLVVRGSVARPGVEVLAHSSQHHTKEPALTASEASLVETEVEFLAFDGAFGTRAMVGMEFPERGAAPQASEQAIVVARVGIDGPPVG